RGLGQGAQGADRRADTEPRDLMDPVFSAVLLGFVLGLQHATDPDHLVAVATILTRERRFAAGALVGVLWGLGHTATLALAGVLIVGLRLTISAEISSGLELLVAAMLILLGALRLRDAASGLDAVPPTHLVADHDHGHVEAVHSHPHTHGPDVHAHPHVHPSRRLLAALGDRRSRRSKSRYSDALLGEASEGAVIVCAPDGHFLRESISINHQVFKAFT